MRVCSNPFLPLKKLKVPIDGRKIMESSEDVKGPWDVWRIQKEKERGLIYQRLLDIIKVFNEESNESNKKQAQMSGH